MMSAAIDERGQIWFVRSSMTPVANDDRQPQMRMADAELAAYVQGRLPPDRERRVEGFLAANPDLAARTMNAMHMSRADMRRRRILGWLAAMCGVALLTGVGSGVAGWSAAASRDFDGWREVSGGDPPDYVEDAAESREATLLREKMASQIETPHLDAREVRQELGLPIPQLPGEWRILDVQVFPTDDGPALNLVLATERGRAELFAVKLARGGAAGRPALARRGGDLVAYWSRDAAGYVLHGPQSASDLLAAANHLARSANL